MATQKLTTIERFLNFVSPEPNSGCWLWLGWVSPQGYGLFRVTQHRQMVRPHRFAYEHFIGPIPVGLEIDHKCRVRCCVNPQHLEAVTHAENMHRGIANNKPGRDASLSLRLSRNRCKRGHEYTDQNTARRPDGSRRCRQCYRDEKARYRLTLFHNLHV